MGGAPDRPCVKYCESCRCARHGLSMRRTSRCDGTLDICGSCYSPRSSAPRSGARRRASLRPQSGSAQRCIDVQNALELCGRVCGMVCDMVCDSCGSKGGFPHLTFFILTGEYAVTDEDGRDVHVYLCERCLIRIGDACAAWGWAVAEHALGLRLSRMAKRKATRATPDTTPDASESRA